MECTCLPTQINGNTYNQLIGSLLGDCVYDGWEILSVIIAMIGLFASLIAMFPQFITNYKLKNVKGLSFGLLLFWTSGDITNLTGTLLTNQLPTQKYTAIAFTMIDVAMMCQYFYYRYCYPVLNKYGYVSLDDDEEVTILGEDDDYQPYTVNSASALTGVVVAASLLPTVTATVFSSPVVLCNVKVPVSDLAKVIGYVMSWSSGLFYFCSRIPQILQNYHDKSVHGLSFYLFFLSIIGNFGYGLSILIRMPTIDIEFFLATFPYLIGSLGVLLFDFTTMYQASIYGGFTK
ncbi:PQ loop repeat-domain-containing protein [Globomyces pollinis-pini]|nr:PQ loop repeat-domain-containing protein [Globomyces pollinis-pini]